MGSEEDEVNEFDGLGNSDVDSLVAQLKSERLKLKEQEQQLHEQEEELSSQKEELTAAIEELMAKNTSLEDTLTQLRDRSFELDQILYRTSHDLRGPLSSIKGVLALLSLESQSDVIRNYGRHIESKAIQMENLLKSLASLSKSILEKPQLENVDLNKVIWQVIGEYRHLPGWNLMEVSVDLRERKLYTDPALVMIIFQSLLSNAFIFRDPLIKGQMIVQVREEAGNWIIDVIDDGEGIPLPVRPLIFDMFYRGSERSIGNGLGLYVARKAIDRLKGVISFHAEASATRFTIKLPVQADPDPA